MSRECSWVSGSGIALVCTAGTGGGREGGEGVSRQAYSNRSDDSNYNTHPAVSHNCNLTVLSSKYIVLDRKSMPIVGYKSVRQRSPHSVGATGVQFNTVLFLTNRGIFCRTRVLHERRCVEQQEIATRRRRNIRSHKDAQKAVFRTCMVQNVPGMCYQMYRT